MYEAFYGMSGKPFQLNPDPSFYFASRPHRRAMAYLEYGLHQNEGFIVITGEVGAGKTTLVRNLFDKLDATKVVAANLVSTQLDADDILRMVASSFGIPSKGADKADLLLAIEAFLVSVAKEGKRCLLVVDEAQNLTPRAVEELRMLSNFQLETHALLQSFLIGQPEFRQILRSPQMQQLRQRVIAACHIGPLDSEETKGYVEHRLHCVGWKEDNPRFEDDAFKAIFQASGGIPRRINSVSDRLLLSGFLGEKRVLGRADVEEVASELDDETIVARNPGDVLNGAAHRTAGPDSVQSVDLSQLGLDDQTAQEAHKVAYKLSRDDLAARWIRVEEGILHIERSMLRLERSIVRIERSNSASLALFTELIDRLKHRDESEPRVENKGENK